MQVSSNNLLQSYKSLKLLYNVNSGHVFFVVVVVGLFLLLCGKANLLYQLGQHNNTEDTLNMQCKITT